MKVTTREKKTSLLHLSPASNVRNRCTIFCTKSIDVKTKLMTFRLINIVQDYIFRNWLKINNAIYR